MGIHVFERIVNMAVNKIFIVISMLSLLFLAVRKVAKEAALRCFFPVPSGFQGGA
jgi:hypothetical protein